LFINVSMVLAMLVSPYSMLDRYFVVDFTQVTFVTVRMIAKKNPDLARHSPKRVDFSKHCAQLHRNQK